jgi:hypothetical protein
MLPAVTVFSMMNRRSKFRALLYSVLVCLLIASPAWSQDQDESERRGERVPSGGTIKANVNVVNLFFNVKDKHGALIPSLTKDDFQVFEDGKPQTIKYFSADSQ